MVFDADVEALLVMAIALALGFLIGIEREWAQKSVGVRTFPLISLSTAMAAYISETAGWVALAAVGVLVAALSLAGRESSPGFGTTTNMAMVFTAVLGLLVGMGLYLIAIAGGVVAAWSLAWKEELHGFATGLTREELRTGIQLALIAFVIFPFLPNEMVDPWGLINPRTVWWVVILMGVLTIGNYLLLKRYGGRGLFFSSFLGALINSLASVTAVMRRVRASEPLQRYGAACVALAVLGMLLKNLVIFWVLYPAGGAALTLPLGLVVLATAAAVIWELKRLQQYGDGPEETLEFPSPFSLRPALIFGAFFLLFLLAGGLAQTHFGSGAFYLTLAAAAVLSSATATAVAAVLASQADVAVTAAVVAVVLASLVSLVAKVVATQFVGRDSAQTARVGALLLVPSLLAAGAIVFFVS